MQVQLWLRLKRSTRMAPRRASATASSVETEKKLLSSTPQQVKHDKRLCLLLKAEFVIELYISKQICFPGDIMVQSSKGLDFEDTPRLRLVVKADSMSSTSFMAINLILQDVNDNLPRFQLQNYVAYMREAQGYDMPIIQVLDNHPVMLVFLFIGSGLLTVMKNSILLLQVVAEDVDQGQNGQVTYSIQSSGMSGLFKIDPMTGSITTAAIMDREIFTQTK